MGYPLQSSWASHVAQTVRNPPSMQETWVRYLGGEDPLGKGKLPIHVSRQERAGKEFFFFFLL